MIEINSFKSNKKGFTLVEVVVVLVILAILTAIVVPITLNIIDDSGDAEIAMDAKHIWNAAQTTLNNQLSLDEHFASGANNKFGAPVSETDLGITATNYSGRYQVLFQGKMFTDLTGINISTNILKKLEKPENMEAIYFACGKFYDFYIDSEDDMNKAYKVYLVAFKYADDDKVYYYDGKNTSTDWPFSDPASAEKLTQNTELKMLDNGKKINIQMYCIKKSENSKPYDYFKKLISG